jgi:hypothetical protein
MPLSSEAAEFGCPICNEAVGYEQADKKRPDGSPFPYPIYRCTGCDFHFLDPSIYPAMRRKDRT